MTKWSAEARAVIAKVHEGLPIKATFAERKKAIDDAYPFGQRQYWPYKAWLKARKSYLNKYDPARFAKLGNVHETPMERAIRLTKERLRGSGL